MRRFYYGKKGYPRWRYTRGLVYRRVAKNRLGRELKKDEGKDSDTMLIEVFFWLISLGLIFGGLSGMIAKGKVGLKFFLFGVLLILIYVIIMIIKKKRGDYLNIFQRFTSWFLSLFIKHEQKGPKNIRCTMCNKRGTIVEISKCRYCGNYYCTEHRLPEKHFCKGV